MNRFAGQLLTQGAIDELVLFHPAEPCEGGGNDAHLQVIASPGQVFDLHRRIGQGSADGVLNSIRLNHGIGEAVNWNGRESRGAGGQLPNRVGCSAQISCRRQRRTGC